MAGFLAAVGRAVGKVDTDTSGLARYSLKLQVPPGILYGTAPELSLEYCQGTPNGSLGIGWALGGISCIRRAPSNLAFDQANPAPSSYDWSRPKLTLDGVELLNVVESDYDDLKAQYTTEIDNAGKTVTSLGLGFLVSDSTGGGAEYGTTEDSRVLMSTDQKIREWRLKRLIDYHGNAITYTYVTSPQSGVSTPDANVCYLSSIRYTSNIKTNYQGNRIINFDYSSRPDPVVQSVQGDRCVWASLLTAIRFGITKGNDLRLTRSYELAYATSKSSGDSSLISITETSFDRGNKISLLPSTFGYTAAGVSPQHTFNTGSPQEIRLRSTTNNIALFTMNISGRCRADIACIRYDPTSNRTSIKTYLAAKNADGSFTWNASDGIGAEATLPLTNLAAGFPSILSADMNNDGRADFIVPYSDSDNNLRFSISQCIGTGYQSARTKATNFRWTDGSKFMAMDLTGHGPSIIQVFTDRGKLTFRNFPSLYQDGKIGLKDAITTRTDYDNTGTIDWVQLIHAGTGAKDLVRIWIQDIGQGQSQIKATVFTAANAADSIGVIHEGTTSLLGFSVRTSQTKYYVLPCDINADGVQDIVLATSNYNESNGTMVLTLDTYLGNGIGGFKKLSATITKEISAPVPLKRPDGGKFNVTNLNGSNYPSLSYVYQNTSKAYVCISVDGRSDGLFADAVLYNLAGDMPSNNMDFFAADINGNGIGDWLFYTLDNDIPRVVPVYNSSNTVDFLSWAQDPMGLRTQLEYGALSDPAVYTSAVDWKNYTNPLEDSYPVIAAPNYVVTRLDHHNDSAINSLDYSVSIKKTYSKALVNTQGRGWQGFELINTFNVTDNVLTTEKYYQTWPLTGAKCQIDTRTPDGQVLRSVIAPFQSSFTSRGSWKIYRTEKTHELTNMIENDTVVRSNATEYEYDEHGNVVLQTKWEKQRDQLMFQSWNRCAYTSIDGVTGFLTGQKLSTIKDNVNMLVFEPGDVSLTVYENDPPRAVLKSLRSWSTDVGDFSRKDFWFDDYGREVRSEDAAGLRKSTTYDTLFQTSPVKVIREAADIFSTTELTAFDEANGIEVVRLESNGLMTCYRLDEFGRTVETRAQAAAQGDSAVAVNDFLENNPYVTDPSFATVLAGSYLEPQRDISFQRQMGSNGSAYITAKVTTYSKEGTSGQHEIIEFVDCAQQTRKRSARDADDTDKIWMSWEYDSRGQHLFESFPVQVSVSVSDLDWVADRAVGTTSTMDGLGRPVTHVRPAHPDPDQAGEQAAHFIVSATTYVDGGAKVQERTMSTNSLSSPLTNATELARIERRYLRIDQDELVVDNIDENGVHSQFQYDCFGRLTQCTDGTGQIELRTYNSHGDITSIDNPYQNVTHAADTPAIRYRYDANGQLVKETNAAQEEVNYKRDAKGRPLHKMGKDGRSVNYIYDSAKTENLSSITILQPGAKDAYESLFEFTYDHRGRVKDRKLTLGDGRSYTTSITYDWQNQVVQKVLPDGMVVTNDYHGANIASSSLSDGSASGWTLRARTVQYTPFGRPKELILEGPGMNESFTHTWEYDCQGFPSKHGLRTNSKALVNNLYKYNDSDQLQRSHELVTGSTTDYLYKGKRLWSSQSGSGALNTYTYDTAGNLTEKRGTSLAYSLGQVTGTRNGISEFSVTYDNAGRVNRRVTNRSDLDFSYNSLGALQSLNDSKTQTSVEFLTNYDGETLQRTNADGSSDLFLSKDFHVRVQPDGPYISRYHLVDGAGHPVATISNTYQSVNSKRPLEGQRKLGILSTDTKGNVTHVFNGADAGLRQYLVYDDFGSLDSSVADNLEGDVNSTYEGNCYDSASGLLNFGARWYDPLVGRFTTPDNILDIGSLLRSDGLNRYCFENNDPINNIDPTGHWSRHAIIGLTIGVLLVVAAVALVVATGGAAAPLVAAGVGALASGGMAGILFSVEHKDEHNAGKFWGGFATTVAINAAIGAATGALGATAAGGRLAAKAAMGGVEAVAKQAAGREVENVFFGTHQDVFAGAATTFLAGAVVSGVFGAIGGKGGSTNKTPVNRIGQSFLLKAFPQLPQMSKSLPTNPWVPLCKQSVMAGVKSTIKYGSTGGSKIGYYEAQEHGVDKLVENSIFSYAEKLETFAWSHSYRF